MSSARVKAVIQYIVILGITALLTWFSLRGITVAEGEDKWDFLFKTWLSSDKLWLLAMAFVAMLSHVIRAERWRMLMAPAGYNVSFANSFLSLMVGYLINLAIPRGGEVSRCYNLYKLDKTPVEISFGTVVVERIVDVICLILLIALAFVLESQRLFAFIETLPIGFDGHGSKLVAVAILVGVLFVVAMIGYWIVQRNKKIKALIEKTWGGFKEGLTTVFRLDQKGLFLFYSVLIWLLYFLMSYTVIRAFPETEHLGFSAVLSLFAIGSIAMAAPLPGGAGSYHVLVPQGLVFLYNITKKDAVAFTFIFHGWQTALMIFTGAISLVITSVLVKQKIRSSEENNRTKAQ